MRTVRRRFEGLEEARRYADSVNRKLRRKAAIVSEISRIDYTARPDGWTGNLDELMRLAYYEVCFDTRSKKEF